VLDCGVPLASLGCTVASLCRLIASLRCPITRRSREVTGARDLVPDLGSCQSPG
jgi:hypothetical protein